MALLVLLAASARARIVATDFWSFVPDRFHRGIVAADSGRLRGPVTRERGGGGRRRGEDGGRLLKRRPVCSRVIHDERLTRRRLPDWRRGRRLFGDDRTQTPQVGDRLRVDPLLHLLEHLEAFLLVLDKRIALAVAAQPDAFLQMIEAVEMILPLLIDDLEHDVALDPLQNLTADDLLLLSVRS